MMGQVKISDKEFLDILNKENDWYGVFDKLCSMYLDVDTKRTFNSNATKKEIAGSYRRLANIIHPDKKNEAVDKSYFTFLNNANAILSDDDDRSEYNNDAPERRRKAVSAIKAAGRKQMAEDVMQAERNKRVRMHQRKEAQKVKQAQAQAPKQAERTRQENANAQAKSKAEAQAKAEAEAKAEMQARHNKFIEKKQLEQQKVQAGELQGSFENLLVRIRNLGDVPQSLYDQAESIRSNLSQCLTHGAKLYPFRVGGLIQHLEDSISKQEKATAEAERKLIEESIIESYEVLKIRLNEAYQKLKDIRKAYNSEENNKELGELYLRVREIALEINQAIKDLESRAYVTITRSIIRVESGIEACEKRIADELVLELPCEVPGEVAAEFLNEKINLQFKAIMNADPHIRLRAIRELLSIQHECDNDASYQSQVSAAIVRYARPLNARPLSADTELGQLLKKIIKSKRDDRTGQKYYFFIEEELEELEKIELEKLEAINSEEHLPRDVASSAPDVVAQLTKSMPKAEESRMRAVKTPYPAVGAKSSKSTIALMPKRPSLLVSPSVKQSVTFNQSVTLVASPIRGQRSIGERRVIRALPPFPSLKLEPEYNPASRGRFVANKPNDASLKDFSDQKFDKIQRDLIALKCLIKQIYSQRLKKPYEKLKVIEEYDYHNASFLLRPKDLFDTVCNLEMEVVEITRDIQQVYSRLKQKEIDARIAVANAAKVALFSAHAAKNASTVSQNAVKDAEVTAARKVSLFSQYGLINTKLVELIAKLSDDAKIYKSKSKGKSKKITERVSSIRECISNMNEIAKEYISYSESLIRDQNEKELSQFYQMFLQTLRVNFTKITVADVAEHIDLLNTYLSLMSESVNSTAGEQVKQSDSKDVPIAKFRRTSMHTLEELKDGCVNAAGEYRNFSLAEVLAYKEDGESYEELAHKKEYLAFVLNKLKITTSKNRRISLIAEQEVDDLFKRKITTLDWQLLEGQCSDKIPLEASLKKKIFSTRGEKAINLNLMLGKLKQLVIEHLRRQLTYASSRVFGGMEQSSQDHEALSRDLQLKNNTLLVFEQYQLFTNRNYELILCEQHSVKAKVEIVDSKLSVEDFIDYAASLCSSFISQGMSDHLIVNKRDDTSLSKVHQCLVVYEQFRNTFNNSGELLEECDENLKERSFIVNRKIGIIVDLISAGLCYMEAMIGESKHYNPDAKGIKFDDVKQQYSLLKKSYKGCKAESGWVTNTTDKSVLESFEDFSHKMQRCFTEFTGTVKQFVQEISAAADVELTAGGSAEFFPRSPVAAGSGARGRTNQNANNHQSAAYSSKAGGFAGFSRGR